MQAFCNIFSRLLETSRIVAHTDHNFTVIKMAGNTLNTLRHPKWFGYVCGACAEK